jgi:hypothetical protein
MVVRYYSSVAPETTLTAGINNSVTSIAVGSTTGFPATTPYTLTLDYEGLAPELVQVNNAAGLVLDVTRAIDGTSATSHGAGARVRHTSSARDFADSRTHENSDEGVHGLGPSEEIVGTDKVQILTNKTLNSPTITGTIAGNPGFSGTWTGAASAAAKLRLNNNSDVSLASTDHAFQIGPDSAANLRMDVNEIMSANNGLINTLQINALGGAVAIANELAADTTTTGLVVNGTADVNTVLISRAASSGSGLTFKADADTQFRFTLRADGAHAWGPGGVTVPDTALFRSGASQLTVGDNLIVNNALSAASATIPILSGPVNVTGAITASNLKAGRITIPSAGSGNINTGSVVFNTPFPGVPSVNVSLDTAANLLSTVIDFRPGDVTASGFNIRYLRDNTTSTVFMWTATMPTQ